MSLLLKLSTKRYTNLLPRLISTSSVKANESGTPTTKVTLSKFDKYLVKKFSNTKYASINDVPDTLSATQVNYARDKGRAKATIWSVFLTIFISLCVVIYAKREKKNSRQSYEQQLIQEHAKYSKNHQEALKSTFK